MSNTAIQLKKSGVSGNVPSSLNYGELALNYADGRLFYKNSSGVITYISTGGGGVGGSSNSFATINSNSSLLFATSPTDILSFGSTNGITISTNTTSKTITIGASLSDSITSNDSNKFASSNAVNSVYSFTQAAFNKANSAVGGSYDQYARTVANSVNTAINSSNVRIGFEAGQFSTNTYTVAVGQQAGHDYQGQFSTAVGPFSGHRDLGYGAVAVGASAAFNRSGLYSIAVGFNAAASGGVNHDSISIGRTAGWDAQSANTIAIGHEAGYSTQRSNSIAIGVKAGNYNQGDYSIAIGHRAGEGVLDALFGSYQQSIILNATPKALNSTNTGLYISPIRNIVTDSANIVYYDANTKELSYSTIPLGLNIDQYARDIANSVVGIDATQNTQISSTITLAQAAFDKANTGTSADSWARNQVNAAFEVANTTVAINEYSQGAYAKANDAAIIAQAAYAYANTLSLTGGTSVSGINVYVDEFTGDGSTTTFVLSVIPANINSTSIVIDGITQLKTAYTLSGSSVIFSEAPYVDAKIEVTTYVSLTVAIDQTARDTANAAYLLANTGSGAVLANTTNITVSKNLTVPGNLVANSIVLTCNTAFSNTSTNNRFWIDWSGPSFQQVSFDKDAPFWRMLFSNEGTALTGKTIDVWLTNNSNYEPDIFLPGYFKTNTNFTDFKLPIGKQVNLKITRAPSFDLSSNSTNTYCIISNDILTPLQGVNTTQNNSIISVNTLAQAAFDKANTFVDTYTDQVARDTANAAFDKANNIVVTGGFDGGTVSNTIYIANTFAPTFNSYTGQVSGGALSVGGGASVSGNVYVGNDLMVGVPDAGFPYVYIKGGNTAGGPTYAVDNIQPGTVVAWNFNANDRITTKFLSATQTVDSTSKTTGTIVSSGGLGVSGNIYSSKIYTDGLYYAANGNAMVFTDQAARNTANLAISVNDTQNTKIQAVDNYSTSAYNQSNTATILAQAAFDKANTGISSATDQVARNTANASFDKANSASNLAQSAYNYANTLISGGSSISISNDNTSNNVVYLNFSKNSSGSSNTIYTSDEGLTYNPSNKTLSVQSLNISSNTNISSNNIDLLTTNQVVIDSFPTSVYRSAFYQVQISNSSGFHILNLNLLHNGADVFVNTFGSTYTTEPLGSFSGTVVNGLVNLRFTPLYGQTTVTFIRNAIAKLGVEAPSGALGFVSDPVTITFDAGYDSETALSTFDYGTVG